jgi:hypothetical protein
MEQNVEQISRTCKICLLETYTMTKVKFVLGLCCLLFSLSLLGVQAQETNEAKPSKSQLKLVWVVDANPHEFVWQVDGLPSYAFKSLSSDTLRKWVADLPANSTIEWSPSDLRIGGEPPYEEVKQFQNFCKAENVKFIIHPAG